MQEACGLSEYYGTKSIIDDIRNLFHSPTIQHDLNNAIPNPRMLTIHVFYSLTMLHIIKIGEYWKDKGNQKSFLESYAKVRGFDPLDPEAWYKVNLCDIKVYHRVIHGLL